ncbi:MAG TPA: dihydrolipoamide acyltransferase [Bacteroidetes bacterium]|nr:dihydrolipoamide acyltransferase [Bacteroidota bacterium]
MNIAIKEGEELELTVRVKATDTARIYGSGLLDVYSTPAMVAFMEKTSMQLVQPYLEKGHGTVGISLDIKHMKAVPVGEEIRCTSRLSSKEDKRLTFEVKVFHNTDLVGEGKHSRYIIEEKSFLSKIMK